MRDQAERQRETQRRQQDSDQSESDDQDESKGKEHSDSESQKNESKIAGPDDKMMLKQRQSLIEMLLPNETAAKAMQRLRPKP